jgi:hypothetical protein
LCTWIGELQVLLHRGEGSQRDTVLLYMGPFTVALRKGMYVVRDDRTYAMSFDGQIYRIVISPFIDSSVFGPFDLRVCHFNQLDQLKQTTVSALSLRRLLGCI